MKYEHIKPPFLPENYCIFMSTHASSFFVPFFSFLEIRSHHVALTDLKHRDVSACLLSDEIKSTSYRTKRETFFLVIMY